MSFSPAFKVFNQYGFFQSDWYFSTKEEASACGKQKWYKWTMASGFWVTEFSDEEHPVNSKWDFEKKDFYENLSLNSPDEVSPDEVSPDEKGA